MNHFKRWAMFDQSGHIMLRFWTKGGAQRFTDWVNFPPYKPQCYVWGRIPALELPRNKTRVEGRRMK